MNYTAYDLLTSMLSMLAFGVFLLPLPYLLLRWTDVVEFRSRSAPERILWVTGLSIPFSLFMSSIVGRVIAPGVLLGFYIAAAVIAAVLLLPRLWQEREKAAKQLRLMLPILLALLAFMTYVLIITCSVQIHAHLYESVNFSDWSVRLPMVGGALRNGVPPGNPFFTVHGQPQPARYYYYWYVLCAAVGRPLHLPARACLAGSVLWSGLALIATLFLVLRHLLGFRPRDTRRYLWPLLLCCVMGLDVIMTFLGYSLKPPAIFPDIEWWLDDRIPSFLGAVIFAPHHIGGLVCCTMAFLTLFLTREPGATHTTNLHRWRSRTLAVVTAGVCFAACAGDSTFIALCFIFVGIIYALDLIRHARWAELAILCASGLFAALVSIPYLRELTLSTPGVPAQHHQILEFALRNRREKEHFAGELVYKAPPILSDILYATISPLLVPVQFGFFLLPLCMRVVFDYRRLRAGQRFSDGERLLWAIFLGAAIPGFFFSSAPAGVNDLGRHAGLILRLVLVAWSVPLLWPYVERLRRHESLSLVHPFISRFAVVLFGIGLVSQFWQITVSRGLMLFLAHHPKVMPAAPIAQENDVGARFFQLRQGLDAVGSRLPANAIIQSNMTGPFQTLVMLYSSHPFAAGDISCESAFGGDTRLCKPMVSELHDLYYTSPAIPFSAHVPYRINPRPDVQHATVKAFEQACRDEDLAAVVVQNSDIVWTVPTSWVWQLTPIYTNSLVRIFGCPAYFPEQAEHSSIPVT